MSFKGGILVYSMWGGYQKKAEINEYMKACESMGLKTLSLHTSGHADPDTIRALIDRVNPTEIIPVHTENAAWFKDRKAIRKPR